MARARNIKPKFFLNDELAEISPLGRLLFIGLWTICDYRGVLEYRPARIKAQLLPYDECNTEALLNDLDKSGFISIFTVKGQQYIKVVKFEQHQTPHKNEREAGTEFPDISESDNEINELKEFQTNPDKNGATRAESLFPLPSSGILPAEPEAAAGAAPKVRQKPREAEDDDLFMAAWNSYPKRPGASRADSFKAWEARLKEKADPEAMLAGVRRYAEYVQQSGTEPQYVKQPATFFGPGKHYEAEWAHVADRRTSGRPSINTPFKAGADDNIFDELKRDFEP